MNNIIWKDKKRPILGLPLSFTRYFLTDEKLIINTGFLSKKEDEIRLYRMTDFSVTQKFFQRLFKVGIKYKELMDKGIISQEEFEKKKNQILGL